MKFEMFFLLQKKKKSLRNCWRGCLRANDEEDDDEEEAKDVQDAWFKVEVNLNCHLNKKKFYEMHFSDERSSSFGQIQNKFWSKLIKSKSWKHLNIQNVMYF